VYAGQTGRHFQISFKEHALSYKNNYSNSGYAQNLIKNGNSLDQMGDIMDVIISTHRGKRLDTFKK